VRVGILSTYGKLIIVLTGEVWTHKTSLTPPLFIEVPVPTHDSERFHVYVW
jgi:hypothetical protein